MKRNARYAQLILAGTILVAASVTMTAQEPLDPSLAYVRVTANERSGRVVSGLLKDEFKVFEDNVPQDIVFFSATRDVPITVGVLLDTAGGDKDRMKDMASGGLIRKGRSSDEIYFTDTGNSPLNDAVYQGLDRLLHGQNDIRALVLFTMRSDPADSSFSKVKELLRDRDVRLYVIGLPTRVELASDQAWPLLRELAEVSGGSAFFPSSTFQVQDIYRKIGNELRNQYLIGYHSTNVTTGRKWRKIKVNAEHVDKGKVVRFTIRAKTGYYSSNAGRPLSTQK